MARYRLGQGVIVLLAKAHGMFRLYVMEVGQWVGRYDLKVDTGGLHIRDANVCLHKGATLVPNTIEPVVAHTKPRSALVGVADLGAVLSRRTHRSREHGVRVDVDGVCLGECNAIRHIVITSVSGAGRSTFAYSSGAIVSGIPSSSGPSCSWQLRRERSGS